MRNRDAIAIDMDAALNWENPSQAFRLQTEIMLDMRDLLVGIYRSLPSDDINLPDLDESIKGLST